MFKRLMLAAVASATLIAAGAEPAASRVAGKGKSDWNLSRYQTQVFTDSLMNGYQSDAVVVLNRHQVDLSLGGDAVKADVEHQWLLFVRDPEGAEAYRKIEFDQYPGRKVEQVVALRLRGKDRKKLDVKKSKVSDCSSYKKHERHVVEVDDLQPGDIIAVRERYVLDGDNPIFSHRFDYEFPVLQSDVRIEVPREMMEGKLARGFNWWAGMWPRSLPNQVWERPKSWRFRWGVANLPAIAANQEPRQMLTTWLYDSRVVRKSSAIGGDIQAAGGGDAAYHGPVVSAQQLSGFAGTERHHGERNRQTTEPSQASFGRLQWPLVASWIMEKRFEAKIGNTRPLEKIVEQVVKQGATDEQAIRALTAYVANEVETIDLTVGASLGDVNEPSQVLKRGCASPLDKCILLAALLRTRGIDAAPVLYRTGPIIPELASVDAFQTVGLQIGSGAKGVFADVATGSVTPRLPSGEWDAVLTFGQPELIRGDDLAALTK